MKRHLSKQWTMIPPGCGGRMMRTKTEEKVFEMEEEEEEEEEEKMWTRRTMKTAKFRTRKNKRIKSDKERKD